TPGLTVQLTDRIEEPETQASADSLLPLAGDVSQNAISREESRSVDNCPLTLEEGSASVDEFTTAEEGCEECRDENGGWRYPKVAIGPHVPDPTISRCAVKILP